MDARPYRDDRLGEWTAACVGPQPNSGGVRNSKRIFSWVIGKATKRRKT
jgi:hypothetical protein